MAIIKEKEQSYEPVSADIHRAVCVEFVDLGILPTKFGPKPSGKYYFQVEEKNSKSGVPKTIGFKFNMSTGSSSKPSLVRSLLKGWRGRDLTNEEAKDGFDLASIVGTQGRLVVELNPDAQDPTRIYDNIKGALPYKAGDPVIVVSPDYVNHEARMQKKAEWEAKNKPNADAVSRASSMNIPY